KTLRGISSSGVTGFTTPRYPSVWSPFVFSSPLVFAFSFPPSRVGEKALHEKLLPLCLLLDSHGQQITPTAIEKCVNCQGKNTSFSRSCPKWKVEKEIVATKFKNNLSFPEARRLVKTQSPPDGKSYASVVDKNHPVYHTTHCPHCKHVVTMSNFPSTSKSPEPVAIASSCGTKNILPQPSSQTSAVLLDSQDSAGFTIKCRGIRSKFQDLKGLVNYFHPVCIGLQETFLSSNNPLELRGYNSVRKDAATGSNHSGGVYISTSNLYPSIPLTLHTSLQAVTVQVHARTLDTVCSVYLPPHDVISQQDLDVLVDQLPTPFILLGDFNGHSILWGSDVTNSRGRQIEQLISNNCLCLLNNDEKTYFHEPTCTFHSLDLAICSPTLLPLLHFTVGSDLCNSDHFPITVSYADSGGAIQYPPRYLFQRADWDNFMQLADITESMVSTADQWRTGEVASLPDGKWAPLNRRQFGPPGNVGEKKRRALSL
ncbi:hypothetical protein AVEN_206551-1, partial [Araneus ventricosus]